MSATLGSPSQSHRHSSGKGPQLGRIRHPWRQIVARFSFLGLGRRPPQVFHLPPDLSVDVHGLPGDAPSDVPTVLSTISGLMDGIGVRWCIVGDLLLAYYRVPKITEDLEICMPLEDLDLAHEAFMAATEFCFPFRPGRSTYNKHLAQHSRFRVKGMNQCFFLVPASHYGLHSNAFVDILRSPGLDFPLLPLPHYVKGLAAMAVTHSTDDNNFVSQIEFLIDGMDIDEEWCHTYLDGPSLEFVLSRSTRSAKKDRMGSHPKYEGNLTTYIHNELEREAIIRVVGRVMDNNVIMTQSEITSGSQEGVAGQARV